MIKAEHKPKVDNIIVKNIYKENTRDKKIQKILIKSYKIFIQKELKEGGKCLIF